MTSIHVMHFDRAPDSQFELRPDIYQQLGNVYLPAAKNVDTFFLRQIMSGEKKVIFNPELSELGSSGTVQMVIFKNSTSNRTKLSTRTSRIFKD